MSNNPISEKDFRQQILDLAELCGWKCYFTWNSIHSPAGFPDLILVREKIIFAEIKSEKGKLSDAQKEWRDALENTGGEYYCWKPSDWETMVGILKR